MGSKKDSRFSQNLHLKGRAGIKANEELRKQRKRSGSDATTQQNNPDSSPRTRQEHTSNHTSPAPGEAGKNVTAMTEIDRETKGCEAGRRASDAHDARNEPAESKETH